MGNKIYIPQPFDTSDVELPPRTDRPCEQIAKNVHDVWSIGHIKESWTYGPGYDDVFKNTSASVPYEELPE